jgi:hypothetical protein
MELGATHAAATDWRRSWHPENNGSPVGREREAREIATRQAGRTALGLFHCAMHARTLAHHNDPEATETTGRALRHP